MNAGGGPPKMTADEWRTDLDFMAGEMERVHKDLFHKVSRRHYGAAVKRLRERVHLLARHQVIVEIARVVAMVGDAHTTGYLTHCDPAVRFQFYPLPWKRRIRVSGYTSSVRLPKETTWSCTVTSSGLVKQTGPESIFFGSMPRAKSLSIGMSSNPSPSNRPTIILCFRHGGAASSASSMKNPSPALRERGSSQLTRMRDYRTARPYARRRL
jgi:hypothetical protein